MTQRKLKADRKRIKDARGSLTSGSYKSFSSSLYRQYDKQAAIAVLEYLESIDVWASPNEDTYGPDLVVWEGFRPMRYVELAIRSAWTSGDWPPHWDPVRIEERKLKNFQLALPCEYWVICGDSSSALVVPSGVIERFKHTLHEVSNAQVSEGERFIQIPLEECIQKSLAKGYL